MTLGGLATHLINLLNWQMAILQYSDFDLSTVPLRREALEKRADILDEFDANVKKVEMMLTECDEKTLGEEWTLRHGDHIIRQEPPRAIAFRTFGLSHMVHHRAQLGYTCDFSIFQYQASTALLQTKKPSKLRV